MQNLFFCELVSTRIIGSRCKIGILILESLKALNVDAYMHRLWMCSERKLNLKGYK